MTTEAADRNDALHDIRPKPTIEWRHKKCGHFQQVPVSGGVVECENCEELIELKPKQTKQDGNKTNSKSSKKKSTQSTFSFGGKIEITNDLEEVSLETHRIHGRNKLTKFVSNGSNFRSVGYDWNIDLILEFINRYGYEKSVIIVGHQLSANAGYAESIVEIYKLIAAGTLELRVRKNGTLHEKFFIINGIDENGNPFVQDINGSSNPTMSGTGKKGSQSNRVTDFKFTGSTLISESDYLKKLEKLWDDYIGKSEIFEGDLMELLESTKETEWLKTVKKYYDGEIVSTGESERTEIEILRSKVGGELLRESLGGKKIAKLELGDFSKEIVDEFLTDIASLGFQTGASIDGEVDLPVSILDSTKYSTDSLPYMHILNGNVYVRFQGDTFHRTEREFTAGNVNQELEKLEKYINTVENSHSPGTKSKMAIGEFLLSGMCSPFDHMWMDLRKSKFNRVAEGPQMTSYAGTSGNGKSYASRYLLAMLTALDLEPLTSKAFTETRVCGAAKTGNIMPLVFDDLKRERIREWEKWGKFYWDKGHAYQEPFAQLLVTANDPIDTQGPLGRRVREIWMDATFDNNGENTEIVEQCLEQASQIFLYFSGILLDKYFSNEAPYDHNDPLKVGRDVISELYKIADRDKPKWWCMRPYSECVDTNAYQWFDNLNKDLFKTEWKGDAFVIHVDEAPHEINERLRGFKGQLKAKKASKTIAIRNSKELIKWLKAVESLYVEDNGKPTRKMRRLLRKRF
jgi:hypothetical protein